MLPVFTQALPGRGSILARIGEPTLDGASRGLTVRGYSFSAPCSRRRVDGALARDKAVSPARYCGANTAHLAMT